MPPHCLHVLVVGFHHKKGAQVDYIHPPLDDTDVAAPSSPNTEVRLPPQWAHLPSLALPDGAHNVEHDIIYFVLPSLTDASACVYCVADYRQIASNTLLSKSSAVTRSSVQKSVVIVCRRPLFGYVRARLALIAHAYFNGRDFDAVQELHAMYDTLVASVDDGVVDEQMLFGIDVRDAFAQHKHKLLVLFKLALLERRVLYFVFPVDQLMRLMMAVVSLFPRMLDDGLNACAITGPADATAESADAASAVTVDRDGMPLSIYTNGNYFNPYVCLAQMDALSACRACTVGATNALYKQRDGMFDAIVTVDAGGELHVTSTSDDLKRRLTLTTADLRFVDYITRTIVEGGESNRWDGSDDWCRLQMKAYLISMCCARNHLDDYNEAFMRAWQRTHNHAVFAARHMQLSAIDGHPFAGGTMGMQDVKLRIDSIVNTAQHARRVQDAIGNTSRYIGDASTRVKGSVSSWLNKMTTPAVSGDVADDDDVIDTADIAEQ